jgi:uncharacterized protein YecE (DUF72 family)
MAPGVRIGCCGFPTSHREYREHLSLVEVQQTFYEPPKVQTARRWREEMGEGFEFTIKAWQLITHEPTSPTYRRLARPILAARRDRYGAFRDTEEVWEAWATTEAIAQALGARAILFQCPASFTPTETHKQSLRRFFERVPRAGWIFAFEPRGVWEPEEIAKLCRDLDLLHAVDPLRQDPSPGRAIAYFRLHGPVTGRYRYSDEDLQRIAAKCREGGEVYCLFNNPEMWNDARRLRDLLAGHSAMS